tara:strand:- start:13561 stop:14667 length:1107 start_codon:yes stop_codon:yes gene_type:complete
MHRQPFFYEQKHLLAQFAAALDGILIDRTDRDGNTRDKIEVRVTYGTKRKVTEDLVNKDKGISLPVVSFWKTGIQYDAPKVSNKYKQFHENALIEDPSGQIINIPKGIAFENPQPVEISIDMTIMTKFMEDLDRIESNLFTFFQPYIILSTKLPDEYSTTELHEIRHKVTWNGSLTYKDMTTNIQSNEKVRFEANTSFVIKGLLFKDRYVLSDIIHTVETDFNAINSCNIYDDIDKLDDHVEDKDVSIYNGEPRFESAYHLQLFNSILYRREEDDYDVWDNFIYLENSDTSVIITISNGANLNHIDRIVSPNHDDKLVDYLLSNVSNDKATIKIDLEQFKVDGVYLNSQIELIVTNNAGSNTLPIIIT